jgi:hypothetical protein
MVVGRLIRALNRPVDAASCAAFRILFGALLLLSTARFFSHGWISDFYQKPTHFFHYWGLSWLKPLPGVGMYVLYAVIAGTALCIALGAAYRVAACVFTLAFSYAHFCDKANYLNHYYLVSLLGCLLTVLPLDREFSLRVWRRPSERRGQVRAWVLYLLRFQVGVVYVFGGLAKLGADWLIHGEPLRIWLSANAELPLMGRWLNEPQAGLVFSYCGALFDLSIVPLLIWKTTRRPAYAALLVFHALTALLFRIGMFPWIMIVCATIFWSPIWPRDVLQRLRRSFPTSAPGGVAGEPLGPQAQLLGALYVTAQLLLPLRSALYPGNTLWTEEGFRFSWKVMLIEKAGSLEFTVVDAAGRSYLVTPRQYLTAFQARMASTQPDMVQELASWIARDFEARGHGPVRVYADCEVSFNGRLRHRMLDPHRDLAHENDGLAPKRWILPAPVEAPLF